jgi:hypothetical protein
VLEVPGLLFLCRNALAAKPGGFIFEGGALGTQWVFGSADICAGNASFGSSSTLDHLLLVDWTLDASGGGRDFICFSFHDIQRHFQSPSVTIGLYGYFLGRSVCIVDHLIIFTDSLGWSYDGTQVSGIVSCEAHSRVRSTASTVAIATGWLNPSGRAYSADIASGPALSCGGSRFVRLEIASWILNVTGGGYGADLTLAR